MTVLNYFSSDINKSSVYSDSLKLNIENLLRRDTERNSVDELSNYAIKKVAIGPTHVAVLTLCGKVCRIPIKSENVVTIDPTLPQQPKKRKTGGRPLETSNLSSRNVYAWRRFPSQTRSNTSYVDFLLGNDQTYNFGRRSRSSRASNASESLVEQVQGILHSHSRSSIVRELLRSNLSINPDDNPPPIHMSEQPTTVTLNTVDQITTPAVDQGQEPESSSKEGSVSKAEGTLNSVLLDHTNIEWLLSDRKFKLIGAMCTDLVLVDTHGFLHQWRWSEPSSSLFKISDDHPLTHTHSKSSSLKLEPEKICDLYCSLSRAIALTESNKVVTFLDRKLWNVHQLEGCRYVQSDKRSIKVTTIECNDIYSIAQLADGSIYWWGVLPYSQRSKMLSNIRKSKSCPDSVAKQKIPVGSLVTTCTNTIYQPGALAYYFENSTLKMGTLTEQLSSLKYSAKFKEQSSESASLEGDDAKIAGKGRLGRSRKRKHVESETAPANDVTWSLANVVFLSERSSNIGVVVKVDKESVLVEFETTKISSSTSTNVINVGDTCRLKNTRIFNMKELKVVKKYPKRRSHLPHCMDVPHKLETPKSGRVIGFKTTVEGVYFIVLNQDDVTLHFLIPGMKSFKITKLTDPISQMLLTNKIEHINFKIHQNCLCISVPERGTYILMKNKLNNYMLPAFPCMPTLKIFEFLECTNPTKFTLSVCVFDEFPSFKKKELLFNSENIFRYNYGQNILHFLARVFLVANELYGKELDEALASLFIRISNENQSNLSTLLTSVDFSGMTPFLHAIKSRSYKYALILFKYLLEKDDPILIEHATQISSGPYFNNPIYLLCSNEACSFLWTGNQHTPQEVYECLTCDLTDKLCCCSDCVLTCHRGHEVTLKTSSPTAFCDCWEVCQCQAVNLGSQKARRELLKLLIKHNILLKNLGTGYDHIMLFIVRTIARHDKEVAEYKKLKSSSAFREKSSEIKIKERSKLLGCKFSPVKNPLKFLSYALTLLLKTKESVQSLFTFDNLDSSIKINETLNRIPYISPYFYLLPPQTPGKFYDCFIFSLLISGKRSFCEALHKTFKHSFKDELCCSGDNSSNSVLSNFIRSCGRIYITVTSLMSPFLLNDCYNPSKKNDYRILRRLIYFFRHYPLTSISEIAKLATVLFNPVMYGILNQKNQNYTLIGRMIDVIDVASKIFTIASPNQKSVKKNVRSPHPSMYLLDEVLTDDNNETNDDYLSDEFDSDTDSQFYELEYDEESDNPIDDPSYNPPDDEDFEDTTQDVNSSELFTASDDEGPETHAFEFFDDTASGDLGSAGNLNRPHSVVSIPFSILTSQDQRSRTVRSFPNPHHAWAVRPTHGPDARGEGITVVRSSMNETVGNDPLSFMSLSLQCGLARSFSIAVKLISDLIVRKKLMDKNLIPSDFFKHTLGRVFLWLFDVCDSFESKIRFGIASLSTQVPSLQPGRHDYEVSYNGNPENLTNSSSSSNVRRRRLDEHRVLNNYDRNRYDFIGFVISHLRSGENEHFGILPYMDFNSHKHVAFVLDSYVYFLDAINFSRDQLHGTALLPRSASLVLDYKYPFFSKNFFSRSSSTLFLKAMRTQNVSNSAFTSLAENTLSFITKNECIDKRELMNIEDLSDNILTQNYRFIQSYLISGDSDEKTELVKILFDSTSRGVFVRWYNIIEIFGEIFIDSVGIDSSSIYRLIGSFESKEFSFNACLDKLRALTTNELYFESLDRKPAKLLIQTFKCLNNQISKGSGWRTSVAPFTRVKASFKNEPGEGSGVTRNFFSVLSQAIISQDPLPDLAPAMEIFNKESKEDIEITSLPIVRELFGRSRTSRFLSHTLNHSEAPTRSTLFLTHHSTREPEIEITLHQIEEMCRHPNSQESKQVEARVAMKLKKLLQSQSIEITDDVIDGLLQLAPDVLYNCLIDENYLKKHIEKISKLFGNMKDSTFSKCHDFSLDNSIYPENAPLFTQPGRPGFYFPTNAKKTFTRLNAYKNVGRIIGLAFISREVIPIVLCRPAIKFLLDRPIVFDDFAFFDPVQYDSLKLLYLEAEKFTKEHPDEEVEMHSLTFCLNIYDSNKNPHTIDLIPDGSTVSVTNKNVDKYIHAYVEYHLVQSVKPELTNLREGLYEMVHPFALQVLCPEDFRLILNGASEISVDALKKVVDFADETANASKEKIARFKKWFWEVVEELDQTQRSELMQFWTSSPLLGVIHHSTKPNITLRPPSGHLPTSNTCVLRLYLPMYKRKSILKEKILTAIKTKTFGFI